MQPSKWWKCDLQVATPAWRFHLPAGSNFDLLSEEDRSRFANLYIQTARARGVEVIAIADHNTHEWIDVMKAAGDRNGVIVFPGCEVTTGTGADGVHLLIIGDRHRSGRDFDQLLAGALGFDADHPRFHDNGNGSVPAASSKTLMQILDDLPDDYLVIAPHALNDNGIASKRTARGDIRWKAMHHPRLNAVDPGDCSAPDSDAWNSRFRQRQLDHFPCLASIAYVATSDAYALDAVGGRFSWLRMAEPSLEAMRQAFLDHEARIICNWDPRLANYPNQNPNEIRHGWIKTVTLTGLGNSQRPLTIPLSPGLNALIGGRGSGKSTVVAAIRRMYGSTENLPDKVRVEAESFADTVFVTAKLEATHLLPNSQEVQTATWSAATGQLTRHDGAADVATTFRVRVVNQKELFERVAKDKDDPFAASRSFLAFIDESLGFSKVLHPPAGSWWRRYDVACTAWMNAMRSYQNMTADLAQMPAVQAKVLELEAQIAAFDSDEAKARRKNIKDRQQERDLLAEEISAFEQWMDILPDAESLAVEAECDFPVEASSDDEFNALRSRLSHLQTRIKARFTQLRAEARQAIDSFAKERDGSNWWKAVQEADQDAVAYVHELEAKGIDPRAYGALQQQLRLQKTLFKQLGAKEPEREGASAAVTEAWSAILAHLKERIEARRRLLTEVGGRSGTLRFDIAARRDVVGWSQAIRELLNLRSDAFLDEVPALALWLWGAKREDCKSRWATWRQALATGDFTSVGKSANLRPNWVKKLQTLDPAVRLRLAAVIADDVVTMQFLRDGGDPSRDDNWQNITEGSPGQRTAAMLGFVLHHGVEPLVLDQPEDDLDTEWISNLVVKELRASRWKRQIVVVTHNANIPVNGDADQVVVLENTEQSLRVRSSGGGAHTVHHCGPIELREVRNDIQNIMEGGVTAFIRREKKYNNELRILRIGAAPDPR
jgi:hypothetical protein